MPKTITKQSDFAENLTRIRKQHNLSQKQLADLTGISPRMIAYYETTVSHPSIKKIELFAKALNVHPSDLMHPTQNGTLNTNDFEKSIQKVNVKTLKQVQKILLLNKVNRQAIYRMVDALLKEQEQKLTDKSKSPQ